MVWYDAPRKQYYEERRMIGTDYHIHTHYVGCAGKALTIPAILERCRGNGRTSIAITDHCDKDWQLDKNRLIREELEQTDPGDLEIFFGCELNAQDLDGSLVFNEEQVRDERFEIIVAGVHSTWFKPGEATLEQIMVRQIELMCKVVANPIVDVLVHPWWIPGSQFKGELAEQFTSLEQVPDELTAQMVETCIKHDTAVEMNAGALLSHPFTSDEFKASYTGYVAKWIELGAMVALSSDAHGFQHFDQLLQGEQILVDAGLPEAQVWHPKVKPAVTGSKLATREEDSDE
jgi:histidinol phosphatase-like PHP family hydrolase